MTALKAGDRAGILTLIRAPEGLEMAISYGFATATAEAL